MEGRNIKKKFFRRFWLTYLIILLIPFAALLFLSRYSSTLIEEKLLDNEISLLEQSKTFVDSKLTQVSSQVQHHLQNTKLTRFLYIESPMSVDHVVLLREVKRGLREQDDIGDIVLDWFVLYDQTNFVLGPGITYHMDRFYGNYYTYGSMDYEQWRSDKFSAPTMGRFSPATRSSLENRTKNIVEYTVSFPGHHTNKAVLTVLLDGDILSSYLSNRSKERTAFLLGDEDQLILSTGGGVPEGLLPGLEDKKTQRIKLGDDVMLVSSLQSPETGLRYVSMISSDLSLTELSDFRRLLLILVTLATVIALMVSLRLAGVNAKPIHTLVDENTALSDTIERQMPLLHSSFLENLLMGKHYNDSEIEEHMAWLNIPNTGKLFVAGAFSVDTAGLSVSELNDVMVTLLSKIKLVTATQRQAGFDCSSCLTERNIIALLFTWQNEDEAAFIQQVSAMMQTFAQQAATSGNRLGIGSIYKKYRELSKSYSEAIQTINYFSLHANDTLIHCIEEVPRLQHAFYFPVDMHLRILSMMKDGNSEGVHGLLKELYTENIINRDLSPVIMDIFISNLWVAILEIADSGILATTPIQQRIEDAIAGLGDMPALEKLQTCMNLCIEICDAIHRQGSMEMDQKAKDILLMIKKEFRNENLSLKLISEKFNISESYFSLSFKEWTGENFYTYLQNLRISEAASLLVDSNRSMQEISTEVGYNSYNTFARAFKRTMGISATKYRSHHRQSE